MTYDVMSVIEAAAYPDESRAAISKALAYALEWGEMSGSVPVQWGVGEREAAEHLLSVLAPLSPIPVSEEPGDGI